MMKNGARLSVAIKGWVGTEEAMLIAAGEQSGMLGNSLEQAVKILEGRKRIKGAIIGGLAYPAFLTLIALAALYMFGFVIAPAFISVTKGAEWYGLAKAWIDVSLFIRDYFVFMVGAVVTIIVLFFASLSRFDGALRVRLDRYVPYSIYRTVHGSAWLIAMSALQSAGVPIVASLERLSQEAAPWLKRRVQGCLFSMHSGRNLGEALRLSGYEFPDREIMADLRVYADLSGMDEALEVLGNEWLEESISRIQAQMNVIFAISIMLVGLLVAFMVGGMIQVQLQLAHVLQQIH